jgi:hypothetical protein
MLSGTPTAATLLQSEEQTEKVDIVALSHRKRRDRAGWISENICD